MTKPIISTEMDDRKFQMAMKLFPRQLKMQLGDAFDHIGRHYLKEFRSKQLGGPPGVRGRSRAFFSRFKRVFLVPAGGDITNMGIEIYTDSKVARQHETGGTVTPEGGGKLAVPLSARTQMFTGRGVLKKRYKRPKDLKNVVPIRFNGQTFLTKVKKRSREVEPLYVLKKSVELKPRLGFMRTWDNQTNWRLARLNKAVQKAIDSV